MKYPIPQNATDVEILDPVFTISQPQVNQPPTANAGSDVTITLPTSTVLLQGRGTDPEGNAISFKWDKVSGSGNILSPNAANTEVNSLTVGTSVFRLTVTDDKGAVKTDDVNITVNQEQVPPTPGKFEGFGVGALSALNQTNIISVDSKAKFDSSLGSNRILRFSKSLSFQGRYDLSSYSNLVIDANGFDVTIDNNNNGDGISIGGSAKNIILIGLRVVNAGNDGINVVENASNVIIAYCSAYDNRDGNIDIAGGKYISLIGNIIGRGKIGFAGCSLDTGAFVTYLLNLISPLGSPNEGERCPLVHCNYSPVADPNADIRMNAIMNFGRNGGTGSGYGVAIAYKAHANVVNNYIFDKESTSKAICADDGYGTGATGQVYSAGNYISSGISTLSPNMANNHAEFVIPQQYKVTMLSALDAAKKIKAEVGPAVKNSYEQGLINAIVIP